MSRVMQNITVSNLRMRQEDDANNVEKASYESHFVYVMLRLSSSVVGSW